MLHPSSMLQPVSYLSTSPIAFAHRGGAARWPENTLVAFEGAIALGFRYLETDLHLTRDGVIVCLHDDTLERTTDGRGRVADLTLEELRRVDAGYRFSPDGRTFPFRGQGITVPTLEETLALHPDVRLNVEIKQRQPPMERALWDAIDRLDAADRLLVAAEHDALVHRFRAVHPQRAMPTSPGVRGVLRFWLGVRTRLGRLDRYPFQALQVPVAVEGPHRRRPRVRRRRARPRTARPRVDHRRAGRDAPAARSRRGRSDDGPTRSPGRRDAGTRPVAGPTSRLDLSPAAGRTEMPRSARRRVSAFRPPGALRSLPSPSKSPRTMPLPMIQEGEATAAPEVSTRYRTHRRFDRAARLFTEPGLHRLMESRVVIFGIGGVGSFAAEALARSAVGELSSSTSTTSASPTPTASSTRCAATSASRRSR